MIDLDKTRIYREEAIVVIEHKSFVNIDQGDVERNTKAIRSRFPDCRLALIDHKNVYTLTYDAVRCIRELDHFRAIASAVYEPERARIIRKMSEMYRFKVPFRVFDDRDSAKRWLMKHLND
jgi:hypothetical protein